MTWKRATSFKEQALEYQAFCQLCINERKALGYPDEDARAMVFNNVFGCGEGVVAITNILHQWSESPGKEIIPRIIGLVATTKQLVDRVGQSMELVAKHGFQFTAQSQIENGLRNLARGLGTVDPTLPFYRLAAAIVRATGVPADRHDVLRVPAELRNSLHNNGIFRGYQAQDFVIVVNGCTFEFRHEQRVQCASMSHLAVAFSAAIEVFGELCRTSAIQAIPAPLMDHFAWDKLTSP